MKTKMKNLNISTIIYIVSMSFFTFGYLLNLITTWVSSDNILYTIWSDFFKFSEQNLMQIFAFALIAMISSIALIVINKDFKFRFILFLIPLLLLLCTPYGTQFYARKYFADYEFLIAIYPYLCLALGIIISILAIVLSIKLFKKTNEN